jgi:hypothetical protein
MDERQDILAELNRYRMFRELLTEEHAIAALDKLIRHTSDRLAQLESGRSKKGRQDEGAGYRRS